MDVEFSNSTTGFRDSFVGSLMVDGLMADPSSDVWGAVVEPACCILGEMVIIWIYGPLQSGGASVECGLGVIF